MDIIELREFCLSLPGTEETTPFDETTLVYKVGGKMYLLADMEDTHWMNVKCEPETALERRERYPEITAGWHMNKKYWNTVRLDGDLPETFLFGQICESYRLVIDGLPRQQRAAFEQILKENPLPY